MRGDRLRFYETEGGATIIILALILAAILCVVTWLVAYFAFDVPWLGATWRAAIPLGLWLLFIAWDAWGLGWGRRKR